MANIVELSSGTRRAAHQTAAVKSPTGALLSFLAWPFRIVLATKPAREREAERIVQEFGSDRWCDALERRLDGRIDRHRGL